MDIEGRFNGMTGDGSSLANLTAFKEDVTLAFFFSSILQLYPQLRCNLQATLSPQ